MRKTDNSPAGAPLSRQQRETKRFVRNGRIYHLCDRCHILRPLVSKWKADGKLSCVCIYCIREED